MFYYPTFFLRQPTHYSIVISDNNNNIDRLRVLFGCMNFKTTNGPANAFSHRWLCERNAKRDRTAPLNYSEVELAELLANVGCSLISVYIHWNSRGGFLQADAFCVDCKEKEHLFMLSIPSKFDGGHGRDSLSETLHGTVWDDIILRIDRIPEESSRESYPLTWIAAVQEENAIELYGNSIDFSEMGPSLPSIMRENVSFNYDFASELWKESPWDELLALRGLVSF